MTRGKILETGKLPAPKIKPRIKEPDKPPDIANVENPIQDTSEEKEKKRTRKDKKISGWEKKFYKFRCIKMKLNTFTRDDTLLDVIRNEVKELNHIIFLMYHYINFHILYLLENNPELVPKSIKHGCIEKIYRIVTKEKGKFNDKGIPVQYHESMKLFREHLNIASKGEYPYPSRNYRGALLNNASQYMTTAVNNHLKLNLEKRLAKYLKIREKESDGAKAHYWAQRILNLRVINPEYPSKFDNNEKSEKLISDIRQELEITGDKN